MFGAEHTIAEVLEAQGFGDRPCLGKSFQVVQVEREVSHVRTPEELSAMEETEDPLLVFNSDPEEMEEEEMEEIRSNRTYTSDITIGEYAWVKRTRPRGSLGTYSLRDKTKCFKVVASNEQGSRVVLEDAVGRAFSVPRDKVEMINPNAYRDRRRFPN